MFSLTQFGRIGSSLLCTISFTLLSPALLLAETQAASVTQISSETVLQDITKTDLEIIEALERFHSISTERAIAVNHAIKQ